MIGTRGVNVVNRITRQLLYATVAMLVCFQSSTAQDVRVNAGFFEDSLKIGEPVRFFLSARYPSNVNILFPDSTHTFAPFEFASKTYFPTTTEDGVSTDSTIFYLTTFEIDRVQALQLPVYVIQPQDCVIYQSPRDTILLTQLVAAVPDSIPTDQLPLKMNTAYQRVFFEFNTWMLIIAIALLIVIAIVVWIVFGERIRNYFRARRLSKRHEQFRSTYGKILSDIKKTFSPELAESALSTWKKYMEYLEARPYTKLTTRETLMLIQDENLGQNLRHVDRAIYGHETAVMPSLETLQAFADARFNKKLQEVKKNG